MQIDCLKELLELMQSMQQAACNNQWEKLELLDQKRLSILTSINADAILPNTSLQRPGATSTVPASEQTLALIKSIKSLDQAILDRATQSKKALLDDINLSSSTSHACLQYQLHS